MGTHPIFESDFDCLTEWPSHRIFHPKRFSSKLLMNLQKKDLIMTRNSTLERKMLRCIKIFQTASLLLLAISNKSFLVDTWQKCIDAWLIVKRIRALKVVTIFVTVSMIVLTPSSPQNVRLLRLRLIG